MPRKLFDHLTSARHRSTSTPRRTLAGALAGVTALAVAAGVTAATTDYSEGDAVASMSAALGQDVQETVDSEIVAEIEAAREGNVSRSAARAAVDPFKDRLVQRELQSGGQVSRSKEIAPPEPPQPTGDPKSIALAMMPQFGFSAGEFSCLESLWEKESGWDPTAANPTSSAYGIPQALPGSKMASAGADWATNPATQIEWGLGYIAEVYGSPCAAWSHSQANNWY